MNDVGTNIATDTNGAGSHINPDVNMEDEAMARDMSELQTGQAQGSGKGSPAEPRSRSRQRGKGMGKSSSGQIRICKLCGEPLEGQFVRALGGTFHLGCFKCRVSAKKYVNTDGMLTPRRIVARSLLRNFSPSTTKQELGNIRSVRQTISADWTCFVMLAAGRFVDPTSRRWSANIISSISHVLFVQPSLERKTATMNMKTKSTATITIQHSSPKDAMAARLPYLSNSSKYSGMERTNTGIQNAI